MASVNNEIQDKAISHQIGILRRAGSIRDRLIKHLEDVEADISKQLINRAAKGDFTQARMEFMLRDVRSILEESKKETLSIIRSDLQDLSIWEAEFNKKLINGAAPVNLNITMPSVNQLKSAVTSQPFRGKLLREWASELSRSRREHIRDLVRIGFTEGKTIPQTIRDVRSSQELSFRHAEGLVRTATNHVASSSRADLFKENDDIIKNEVYVATLDSRTSPICQSLDGKIIPVGGSPRPPQHIRCRSTTTPVTRSFRELGLDVDEVAPGTRASFDGQVPEKTTYNDWLKRQDEETVADALGSKTKAKLFRKGQFSVDKFVDNRGNTLTLEQLKERDMQAFKRAGIDPESI